MCAKVCMELIVHTTHSCSPASQSRQSPLNLQVSGNGTKNSRAKAPAKPAPAAAGKTGGRAKDGSTGQNADASGQREEEARLLAAVQSVRTSAATDAVGVEDRLKVVVVKIPAAALENIATKIKLNVCFSILPCSLSCFATSHRWQAPGAVTSEDRSVHCSRKPCFFWCIPHSQGTTSAAGLCSVTLASWSLLVLAFNCQETMCLAS